MNVNGIGLGLMISNVLAMKISAKDEYSNGIPLELVSHED